MQFVISKTRGRMTYTSRAPIENVLSEWFNFEDTWYAILDRKNFKIITVDKLKAKQKLCKTRCTIINETFEDATNFEA